MRNFYDVKFTNINFGKRIKNWKGKTCEKLISNEFKIRFKINELVKVSPMKEFVLFKIICIVHATTWVMNNFLFCFGIGRFAFNSSSRNFDLVKHFGIEDILLS